MIEKLFCANQEFNDEAIAAVLEKQYQFAIPEGSLGRLQDMAVRLASHQCSPTPQINKPWVSLFASDHGVFAEDVSESPQEMTAQWVQTFCEGKSAINAMADFSNMSVEMVDVGVVSELAEQPNLLQSKIAAGTQNFTKQAAMSQEQLIQAMEIGMAAAERAKESGADLFISGEVGVANTTSAIAMMSVLSGKEAEELLIMGHSRLMRSDRHKAELIKQALELHKKALTSPLRILQVLGGFETAALCGAYIRCAQLGLTVVVDGFMASVAAWIADLVSRNDQLMHCKSVEMMMDLGKYSVPETLFCICGNCPRLVEWCFFSHQSAENMHELLLEILAVDPIVKFDMRLGLGTGAALVVPIIQQACAVQNHLAKFVVASTEVREQDIDPVSCNFVD